MPRLIWRDGGEPRCFDLKLGTNRIGRHPSNDLQIPHPTISSRHCELVWMNDSILVRDLGSTNGTFVNDQPITEARLEGDQAFRAGDVELMVECVVVPVVIPEMKKGAPPPPELLPDGSQPCKNHHQVPATYECGTCDAVFCSKCIHVIRRVGGTALRLCPSCSNPCEPLPNAFRKPKRSFVEILRKTLKLSFRR